MVRSKNGYYAVLLGPYATTDINSFKRDYRGQPLPPDAMLKIGTGYVETVWPPAAAGTVQTPTAALADQNLVLPGGKTWVQLASLLDLNRAIAVASRYAEQGSRVVRSNGGRYAVVLGPYETTGMNSFPSGYRGPPLPFYVLRNGTGYVETVWPPAAAPP